MDDRSNSERLRGFGNGLTDGQTFAIVELLFFILYLILLIKVSMVSVAVCVDCWYIFSLFVFCWPQCLPSSLPRLSFSQFLSNTSLLSCPCLDSSHCSIFWILTLDLNERNNVLGF